MLQVVCNVCGNTSNVTVFCVGVDEKLMKSLLVKVTVSVWVPAAKTVPTPGLYVYEELLAVMLGEVASVVLVRAEAFN